MASHVQPLSSEIVVVSGLPRSGTSLMMQMLARGGLPVVTDRLRGADIDNPEGYYELDAVKRTRRDAGWVAAARGRTVKVVSPLLYDLPTTESYRVIFMQRRLEEVVASQATMLVRRQQSAPPPERIRRAFELHLEQLWRWLERQAHMQWLKVDYNALLENPGEEIERIGGFLQPPPDAAAMRSAIDPRLYRNRQLRQPTVADDSDASPGARGNLK